MANIPSIKLKDGNSIPLLGFGTGTAWYKPAGAGLDQTLVESLKTAIKLGYTHLDGAETYGTEPELGQAIKDSGVHRSSLFVTTKVWQGMSDIPASFEDSLKKLQLEYVDLYLIHAPYKFNSDTELQAAWKNMEAIKASGRAKSIGVSNYLPVHLKATLATAKEPPAINQIEFHPYLQHPQLLVFQKEHDIAISAYGPLTAITKAKPGPLDSVYAELAKKYGKTEGEIALRWCIDQGIVAITTTGKEDRMKEYLNALTFKLTAEEIKEISTKGSEKNFRGFWKAKFAEDDWE